MPQQYSTDFERKFRGEMTGMIDAGGYFPEEALKTPPDDDHPDGQDRYKWNGGRLYQDGVMLAEWQLHQTLHHFRLIRKEKCFEYCPICLKAGVETAHKAKKALILGNPYPDERRGEYPCSSCSEIFSYLSHLMKHEEHEHDAEHDWKAFEEDIKVSKPIQKCEYISPGRYSKQCGRDAQPGKMWCKEAKHMEQVQRKINTGHLVNVQPDEVESD